MSFSRVLTLDCGAAHVAGGLFSVAAGRLVLERFASRPVVPSELKDDDWIRAVGAAARELRRQEGLAGECVLGLPGHLSFNRLIRVPPVSARQRRRIIRFEESQGLPTTPDEMIWSHAPVSIGADGRDVILAAAKLRVVTALGAQLGLAGFPPLGVIPAGTGLRNALCLTHPQPAEVLVLSVGARSAQLYWRGTDRCFVRTLALGGNAVTQKVAEELNTDFTRAEEVKREVLGASADSPEDGPERAAVQVAAEQFGRRLCGEIIRSPVFSVPEGAVRPQHLLLTGGGSQLPGLPALLAERLQVRVGHWEPWARVDLGQAVVALHGRPELTQAADLVGLAAWAANRESARVNLLPRALRRERYFRRHWPWLAGAALLVVVGLLLSAWHDRTAAMAAGLQADEVEANLAVLRRFEARNRTNLARLAETNRRILTLQRLAAARSGWAGFLGDLQERLAGTEDVWFERLQLLPPVQSAALKSTPGGAGSEGTGASESAGCGLAAANGRLHLAGCVLDAGNPVGKIGEGAYERARSLLVGLRESPFVAGVEGEHFDGSQPGLLRFEITLVIAPLTLL